MSFIFVSHTIPLIVLKYEVELAKLNESVPLFLLVKIEKRVYLFINKNLPNERK